MHTREKLSVARHSFYIALSVIISGSCFFYDLQNGKLVSSDNSLYTSVQSTSSELNVSQNEMDHGPADSTTWDASIRL